MAGETLDVDKTRSGLAQAGQHKPAKIWLGIEMSRPDGLAAGREATRHL